MNHSQMSADVKAAQLIVNVSSVLSIFDGRDEQWQ